MKLFRIDELLDKISKIRNRKPFSMRSMMFFLSARNFHTNHNRMPTYITIIYDCPHTRTQIDMETFLTKFFILDLNCSRGSMQFDVHCTVSEFYSYIFKYWVFFLWIFFINVKSAIRFLSMWKYERPLKNAMSDWHLWHWQFTLKYYETFSIVRFFTSSQCCSPYLLFSTYALCYPSYIEYFSPAARLS